MCHTLLSKTCARNFKKWGGKCWHHGAYNLVGKKRNNYFMTEQSAMGAFSAEPDFNWKVREGFFLVAKGVGQTKCLQ